VTRPWRTVDSIDTDEGRLVLRQRGERGFLITIDGRVLMSTASTLSEIALAQLACTGLSRKKRPRVLVGGLGMGFTLKAALDRLPAAAEVVVAELNPIMVTWCRGPMARLTDGAVDDPRVTVVMEDVAAVIARAAAPGAARRFDAIMLDLYEGPYGGNRGPWAHIFGDPALASMRLALAPGGVLAVWSEDPDPGFERRLKMARFSVHRHRPGRGTRHVVYVAGISPAP
jgi:spermidine synthase